MAVIEENDLHIRSSLLRVLLLCAILALVAVPIAFGHIKVYPAQSTFGEREKYTIRVPNERQSPTIRIEGEFPVALEVYDFEFKPGWKIDFNKDDKGKIIGATWTGTIAPYEFVEFGMLAINPKAGDPKMLWKFYQYYADGMKEEFTAPPDAQMPLRPMPLVTLTTEGSPTPGARPATAAAASPDSSVAQGKVYFDAYGCARCHGKNGEGDYAASLIGTRLTSDEIAALLSNPSPVAKVKGMPSIPPTSPDLKPLADYILSLKDSVAK
jgi:uncharacterized protein YcnI